MALETIDNSIDIRGLSLDEPPRKPKEAFSTELELMDGAWEQVKGWVENDKDARAFKGPIDETAFLRSVLLLKTLFPYDTSKIELGPDFEKEARHDLETKAAANHWTDFYSLALSMQLLGVDPKLNGSQESRLHKMITAYFDKQNWQSALPALFSYRLLFPDSHDFDWMFGDSVRNELKDWFYRLDRQDRNSVAVPMAAMQIRLLFPKEPRISFYTDYQWQKLLESYENSKTELSGERRSLTLAMCIKVLSADDVSIISNNFDLKKAKLKDDTIHTLPNQRKF